MWSKEKASGLTLQAVKSCRRKMVGHLVRFFIQPTPTLDTLPHLVRERREKERERERSYWQQ